MSTSWLELCDELDRRLAGSRQDPPAQATRSSDDGPVGHQSAFPVPSPGPVRSFERFTLGEDASDHKVQFVVQSLVDRAMQRYLRRVEELILQGC
jgi:hypothetical protein